MKYNTAAYRSVLRDYKVTGIKTSDIKTNLEILLFLFSLSCLLIDVTFSYFYLVGIKKKK